MASYLPVLLISVNANTTPDDNVLTTVSHGQVDYLSHDWLEEDVWRSWRNMTRQKNEITNGVRLENASWRTWWKQRNKLKTVTPETLNWLKDSDVTWLYGPLHTAVDWAPPPKPKPVPDSVDSATKASTHDRLDLHSGSSRISRHPHLPPTKPILKHRSISELLTSDLPISPIFSPQESEDETLRQRHSLFSAAAEENPSTSNTLLGLPRPTLAHTRSDTHISRWSTARAFRKDSPPRIDLSRISSRQSASTVRASGMVRSSLSQDSASSTSASGSSERAPKKKHISFNTFVEQCIAIEKPNFNTRGTRRPGQSALENYDHAMHNYERGDGEEEEEDERELWKGGWDDDDGYEEDREDNLLDEDDPLWLAAHGANSRRQHLNGSAIHSDSDSDDGVIEIRPSSYRHSNLATPNVKKKQPPRSKSASSSSTTTTSTSTSSSSHPRQRRKSGSAGSHISPAHLLSNSSGISAYRPRPHSSLPDPQHRDHITIAPIAPTLLKTTGAWEDGFGDEGGASDDGLWDFGVPKRSDDAKTSGSTGVHGKRSNKCAAELQDEDQGSEETPVELVYVPPFGSIYGYGAGGYWHNRAGEEDEEEEIEELEEVEAQVGSSTPEQGQQHMPKETPSQKRHLEQESTPTTTLPPSSITARTSHTNPRSSVIVPVVIEPTVGSPPGKNVADEGEEEFFGDSHKEAFLNASSSRPVPIPSGGIHQHEHEEERERGRSASVSPIGVGNIIRTSSSSSISGGLLSARGRTQSCQDLPSLYGAVPAATSALQPGNERRGRSNMRTASNSTSGCNSTSLRGQTLGRSNGEGRHSRGGSVSPNGTNMSTSPMGSLSPEGSDSRLGGIGGACASGRTGGRERERVGSGSNLNKIAAGGDDRRGRDRGKRIVGSSASPVSALGPDEVCDRRREGRKASRRSSRSPQDMQDVVRDTKGKGKEQSPQQQQQPADTTSTTSEIGSVDMDASICSVSSESSTATIVPALHPVNASLTHDDIAHQRERQLEREAQDEAENLRKSAPTPSSSPVIVMSNSHTTAIDARNPVPAPEPTSPISPSTPVSTHTRLGSMSSQQSTPPSKVKTKPSMPIGPSPASPSLPSTSSSYARPSVILRDNVGGRSASGSLERASSRSRERASPSSPSAYVGTGLRKEVIMDRERALVEGMWGRGDVIDTGVDGFVDAEVEELSSPTSETYPKDTIMNKAVGMVSNAGAYLRLWPNGAS